MSDGPILLCFSEDLPAASRLAVALDTTVSEISHHMFPDGESLVRVETCPSTIILYRSLHRPNGKLVDLFLAASAARDQGAKRVVLVTPYLPYMRQDIAFHPGEAVSQSVIGGMIAAQVDAVVTVDPHLHRTPNISDVFPGIKAVASSAASAVGAAVDKSYDVAQVVMIGPDEESAPLIRIAAQAAGCSWMVGCKTRHGDRTVDLALPESPRLTGKRVIIFDDVISSGTTIIACAEAALEKGASSVVAYTTHALFGEEDAAVMRAAGVDAIVSCDGIPHQTNGIALAPLLAEAILKCQ
ncbi:MAG: ribose-phosphate diphosphokinase [Rhodospirillaceae bacterium]